MFITAIASALGDKMALGGKVALMGILVVFLLLGLIVVILSAMDAINKKVATKPKKERKLPWKNKKAKVEAISDKSTAAPAAPLITVDTSVTNDAAVIAAIVGALSVVLSSEAAEDTNAAFVVRKIKKLNFRR